MVGDEEDKQLVEEMIVNLEVLLDDLPLRAKEVLTKVILDLSGDLAVEVLMRIQDELEGICNLPNVDSFSRNEIMNVITMIESIVNS